MMDLNNLLPPANPKVLAAIILIKIWSIIMLECREEVLLYGIPFLMGAFPQKFPVLGF
jgi:hypothetical protein